MPGFPHTYFRFSRFFLTIVVVQLVQHSLSRVVVPANARLYLCQRPIYKILVKVRNSKKKCT
jgi:hypothetical protein